MSVGVVVWVAFAFMASVEELNDLIRRLRALRSEIEARAFPDDEEYRRALVELRDLVGTLDEELPPVTDPCGGPPE